MTKKSWKSWKNMVYTTFFHNFHNFTIKLLNCHSLSIDSEWQFRSFIVKLWKLWKNVVYTIFFHDFHDFLVILKHSLLEKIIRRRSAFATGNTQLCCRIFYAYHCVCSTEGTFKTERYCKHSCLTMHHQNYIFNLIKTSYNYLIERFIISLKSWRYFYF